MQNSQSFTNVKEINDNGVIDLKTGQVAVIYKVNPIDLSLTNNNEQTVFFHTLSKLYRLPFTIKAYKFDEKINLNINKENYLKLIKESKNDISKRILTSNLNFIDAIESENMTSASSYYFAIISKNREALAENREEFELACASVVPG